MLGEVPRKVRRDSLVVALRSLGYRTKGETFEVHGYRELRGRRRFHAKVETFGRDEVPKSATIDLHIDRTNADALGVTDDEVVEALVHAHEIAKDRYTVLGDTGLTEEAAERLARITKVI